MGNVKKASWRPLGWLETEWWEVQVTLSEEICEGRSGRRPTEVRGGVVVKKPGNAGGAKARQEGGCGESMVKQERLSLVEETSKQGREAESQRWSWVEAEVWTQRMLTTLKTGVKGGGRAYLV